jgi:type I restriction enzyme S subunit
MTLETFFEKFDLFADAPGAVKKMRELVLELAVSGRLMPEILERSIENETKPMGSIVELVMGQAPSGDDCNAEKRGTVFVKVGEFGLLYPREEVWTTNPLKFAKKGDVLVCVVGATVGKLNLGIDCAIGRSVAAIRPSQALDTQFLYYSLIPYTIRLRRNSRGSAQGVIGKTELNAVSLWVPSRTVQERIVAKVDELMALCDRLEALQLEREAQAGQLARASLTRFADAPTPANLNHLFHSSFPISPSDLRKSILTLAVQGKLVPQDAEPSFLSLESILAEASVNGVSKGPTFDKSATEILRISAGTSRGDFYVNEDDFKHVDLPPDEVEKFQLAPGDLLACRFNGNLHYVGRFSYYQGESGRVQVNPDKLIRFRIKTESHCPRYVCLAMNAAPTREAIEAMCATTAGNIGLSAGRLKTVEIPIPPLAEQRRIVAKVSELMALVDELETQLAASRAAAEKLLTALVAELSGATSRPPCDS